MKKTVCVIAAMLLAAATFAGCGSSLISTTYRDAESYTVGDFTYDAAAVDTVAVDWVADEVNVVLSPGSELTVSESGGALTASQKLHWLLDGTTLRIEFCKSGYSGRFPEGTKKLTVEIPSGVKLILDTTSADVRFTGSGSFDEVALDSTSGNISADVINAGALSVSTTSGSVEFGVVTTETLDVYTTSGDCKMSEVNARTAAFDSTSGNVTIGLRACEELNVDSTSGDVVLTSIPSNGVTVEFDHTSGVFTYKGEKQDDALTVGAGFCRISVSTTSGDLTIE